jgi:membrane protein required for colicin V production
VNGLDIIICIVLLFGLIRGLMRGLIREIFGTIGCILAIIFAIHRFEAGGQILANSFHVSPPIANAISFISIWLGIVLVFYLLGLILAKIARALALRWLDIIGGGGLGTIKVGLIVSLILNALIMFPLSETITKEFNEAILVLPIIRLAPGLYNRFVIRVVPGTKVLDYQKFLAEHTKLPLDSEFLGR